MATAFTGILLVGVLMASGTVAKVGRSGEDRAYNQMQVSNLATDLQAAARYDPNVVSHLANVTVTFTPEPIATPAGANYQAGVGGTTTISFTKTTQNNVPTVVIQVGPTPSPAPSGHTSAPQPLVPDQSFQVPIYQAAPQPSCPAIVHQAGDC
jgi:hypothetical protein